MGKVLRWWPWLLNLDHHHVQFRWQKQIKHRRRTDPKFTLSFLNLWLFGSLVFGSNLWNNLGYFQVFRVEQHHLYYTDNWSVVFLHTDKKNCKCFLNFNMLYQELLKDQRSDIPIVFFKLNFMVSVPPRFKQLSLETSLIVNEIVTKIKNRVQYQNISGCGDVIVRKNGSED